MAKRRALVKQQIAELEQRVAELQAVAVSHSRCHRALLLRDALLTAWCDGLSMLHDHIASGADAAGDAAALAELLQQERGLLQELRACSKGLSSRHKPSEPQGVRTIAPAGDPMALFWQHMSLALAPGAVQLSNTTELATLLRDTTLEISIQVHLLNSLPPSAQEPPLRRLAVLWERYIQGLVSTTMACKTTVVESVILINLETLQPDLEGAREQDQRTADLVPKLQLSDYQMDLIHTGIQLYNRLVAHVQRERHMLQAHPIGATEVAAAPPQEAAAAAAAGGVGTSASGAPAPAATHPGDADVSVRGRDSGAPAAPAKQSDTAIPGSGRGSSGARNSSTTPSSSRVVESMSEWEEHQTVVQVHLAPLNMCLHKEYMLKTTVVGWFLGTLSLEQLSTAAVLSWPFMFRPLWLAKQIHKLRQQELDGQQQQEAQEAQQQDVQGAAG